MKRLTNSLRTQLILLTMISLLVLAGVLEIIHQYQQRDVLINSERRVGLTLIRSVDSTISSVRALITTLSDIVELDVRLAELVRVNDNIDFITVTDADGFVIFHSNSQYEGQTISELAQLPSEVTVPVHVPGYGEVFLTSLSFDSSALREPSRYWITVASASEPIQNQLVNTALSSLFVTALFTVLTALAIIAFAQSYFVRPLEELTEAANAIEAGKLTTQAHAKRNNEIGQLAGSFNRMTQRLAASINTLEERVKARTVELEIARDQAENASRAKSDFLSNMSHELRTPLNMVIGYTSSMLTMPQMYNNVTLPEVFHQDIELIRDSGKHLLALINDILDLSKVEAGKLELSLNAVDLNVIFDEVIAASLGLVGDKPLQLRRNYPNNLPKVWGDPVRVRQIMLNLLSNGIKFTETGSVTLTAEVHLNHVYISVSDTGPGIPESAISTIFDRFEQYQQNNEAAVQGTGLGLDISQRLAQMHGSEITINSKVGAGSTFAFTLPIATEAQLATVQQSDTQASRGNAELFSGDSGVKMTGLIIATDAATRQLLRQILEAQGAVVVEARDSAHMLELATGLLPDFLLIDSEIEGSDPRTLVEMLHADDETSMIPVILLQNQAQDLNPSDFPTVKALIARPIEPEAVIQVVRPLASQPVHED